MRLAVDGDPLLTGKLLVGNRCADARAEHLGTPARHRIESRFAQSDQRFTNAHLVDPRDVRDLDGGEGLDVNVREGRLQSAEHLGVVREAGLHIESAYDMELSREGAV